MIFVIFLGLVSGDAGGWVFGVRSPCSQKTFSLVSASRPTNVISKASWRASQAHGVRRATYDAAEDTRGAVIINLTVSERLRGSLCSPTIRSVPSREMRAAVTSRALWSLATNEHKESGSRRYLRALLPLLVVRSTVRRGPKQEQWYASWPEMDCDKPAHQACEMLLCSKGVLPR